MIPLNFSCLNLLRGAATTPFCPECNVVVGCHSLVGSPLLLLVITMYSVHQYYLLLQIICRHGPLCYWLKCMLHSHMAQSGRQEQRLPHPCYAGIYGYGARALIAMVGMRDLCRTTHTRVSRTHTATVNHFPNLASIGLFPAPYFISLVWDGPACVGRRGICAYVRLFIPRAHSTGLSVRFAPIFCPCLPRSTRHLACLFDC